MGDGDDGGSGVRSSVLGRSWSPAVVVVAVLLLGIALLVMGGDASGPADGTWSTTGTVQDARGTATFSVRVVLEGDDVVDGDVRATWEDERPCDGAWTASPGPGDADVSGRHVVVSTPAASPVPCPGEAATAVLIGDVEGDLLLADLEVRRGSTVALAASVRLAREG